MAIGDNLNLGNNNNSNANENNNKPKKPAAKFWLNPGIDYVDPATGETIFIGMPQGLPLDTMDEVKVPARKGNYQEIQQGKNSLLRQLNEIAAELAPGETTTVNLVCQIRRAEESGAQIVDDNDSAISQAISQLKVA